MNTFGTPQLAATIRVMCNANRIYKYISLLADVTNNEIVEKKNKIEIVQKKITNEFTNMTNHQPNHQISEV